MNAPNQLTLARVVMTFVFVVVLMWKFPYSKTAALMLFAVASLTDLYDGILARRYKIITNFGTLMDPVADKILICSAFVAFVGLQIIPAWMAILVIAREFVITGLRLLAASKGVVMAAGWGGKNKTISQVVAASVILTGLALREDWWTKLGLKAAWLDPFKTTVFPKIALVFTLIAVAFTVSSGWSYLRNNRELFMKGA
jgi:CDP-diacylglycerol--glycerol-3-phosphate 3-phosphatidyltransferase